MPRLPTKLEPDSVVVPPGGAATCRLLVYNHAGEADDVVVSAQGPLALWVRLVPVPIPLAPRSEGSVAVEVVLPDDAAVPAGSHPVLLEVRSTAPGTEPSLVELEVEVPRRTAASLSLHHEGGGDPSVYEARVDNASNHPIHVVTEAEARVPVEVDPPALDVEAFSSASTLVTLHRTTDDHRPVKLTVHSTGDGVALRSSTVVRSDDSRRPTWLPAWAGLAVAGVAALAAAGLVAMIAGRIVGEDPRLEVTDQVVVGPSPLELEFAFGSVWVTHLDGQLWRIDPSTASPIDTPINAGVQPVNLSASPTGDALWIVDPLGRQLVEVDPQGASGPAVVDTVPIDREVVDITAGAGVLWVSALGDGQIIRFEPGVRLEPWFSSMAGAADVGFADGSVWATDRAGRLVRIDPDVSDVQEAEVHLGGLPVAVIEAFGDVWVTVTTEQEVGGGAIDDPAKVVRVDPATNQAVATVPTSGRPWGLAAGDGVVWVVGRGVSDDREDGWVAAIDPDTNEIIAELPLGFAPDGLAFDGSALWVADRPGDVVYRVELRGR